VSGRDGDEEILQKGARRPRRLQPGSRVAVIAPSSGVIEPSVLDRGIRALERFDLEVVVGPAVREIRGYLAGDDRSRADDLLWALSDESVDAVWCARGGYGAQRTVAALDLSALDALVDRPPKPFIGFSDITVLHALISHRLDWVTFYGPGLTKLGTANDYTLASVRSALFDAGAIEVGPHPNDDWITTLVPGEADGVLAGGCLPRLASMVGTPLQVNFAGRICFFEDVTESVMSVDDSLTQMLAAGCFDGCRGIVIGDHVNVTPRNGPTNLGLEQVFTDLLVPLGVPCCFYLPIGHGSYQATLPIGTVAHFDANRGVLQVIGPAVT
jgi:muramoyltetrapeptide carboxypeptidase